MSKAKSTEVALQKPAYLQESETFGLETLQHHVRPPRLKIVQSTAADELKARFKDGDTIVVPQLELCIPFETKFHFVPLFFFAEWCVWNPIQRKDLPVIRERSFDPRSALAVASRDPNRRRFPCPENKELFCNIAEHLNLMVMIQGETPVKDVPVCLTFVRNEWKTGSMLLSMIQLRKSAICSMYFAGQVGVHKNDKGRWFGFDFSNPTPNEHPAWVAEEEFEKYKQFHEAFKEAHANNLIDIDHDDHTMDAGTVGDVVGEGGKQF